jgi:hypothetical protein
MAKRNARNRFALAYRNFEDASRLEGAAMEAKRIDGGFLSTVR